MDYDGLEVHETRDPAPPRYDGPYGPAQKEVAHPGPDVDGPESWHGNIKTAQVNEQFPRPSRRSATSSLTFALLLSLLTALLVGAVVGGGMGNALAKAKEKCNAQPYTSRATTYPSSTSTSPAALATSGSITDYAVPPGTSVASVYLDCPNLEGTTYTSATGATFTLSCARDLSGDDYTSLVAYSYQECVDACAYLNSWQNATVCSNVQFAASMSNAIGCCRGNCWLKGANPQVQPSNKLTVSAVLTTSA